MKVLVFDGETTILNKGNPYSRSNKLCYVGVYTSWDNLYQDFDIEYSDNPFGSHLRKIQGLFDEADVLVAFNAKFDIAWLRRYGVTANIRVFDVQLAEFILSHQSKAYPSLQDTAVSYGLEGKLDVVKTDYWDNKIDTPSIPEEILREYLKQDVMQTYQVYCKQLEALQDKPEMHRLIRVQCQDLLVLQEIEQNGLYYDVTTSLKEGDILKEELDVINKQLCDLSGFPLFNPGSGEHLSALLYGGKIKYKDKGQYEFHHKDGRISVKEKYMEFFHQLPQLIKPLKGSELKKEGYYATDNATLRSLKCNARGRSIINLILRAAELSKLVSTYLHGLPEKITEMGWEDDYIHGQLNQCVARTGRLSSSSPNLQNFSKELNHLFKTRYTWHS